MNIEIIISFCIPNAFGSSKITMKCEKKDLPVLFEEMENRLKNLDKDFPQVITFEGKLREMW